MNALLTIRQPDDLNLMTPATTRSPPIGFQGYSKSAKIPAIITDTLYSDIACAYSFDSTAQGHYTFKTRVLVLCTLTLLLAPSPF